MLLLSLLVIFVQFLSVFLDSVNHRNLDEKEE